MSTDTVDLYNQEKETLINESNFSETATFPGSVEVNGIFDDQHVILFSDSGNNKAASNQPRFIVNERPTGIVAKQTTIVIRSENYKITSISDPDSNGYTTLYLQKVTIAP